MIQPIVSVVMITYGHEKFIAQAINGVLMQECDFEIELIIANDCSPDDTDIIVNRIIENNPKNNIIKYFRHEKNLGMNSNFLFAVNKTQGKYIAFCDGDDYWTDPSKLKKQVKFLDNNLDFGLVHTKYNVFNQTTKEFENYSAIKNQGFIFDELLKDNQIGTLTVLLRKELLIGVIKNGFFENFFLMLDYSIWLSMALVTKIGYINENTAVWRKLEESASNSRSLSRSLELIESVLQIQEHFAVQTNKYISFLPLLIIRYKALLTTSYQINNELVGKRAYLFLKSNHALNAKDYLRYLGTRNIFISKIFKMIGLCIQKIKFSKSLN